MQKIISPRANFLTVEAREFGCFVEHICQYNGYMGQSARSLVRRYVLENGLGSDGG